MAITTLGIQSWRVNHFKSEYTFLNAKYKTEIAEAKALVEQAKASAAIKEKRGKFFFFKNAIVEICFKVSRYIPF